MITGRKGLLKNKIKKPQCANILKKPQSANIFCL